MLGHRRADHDRSVGAVQRVFLHGAQGQGASPDENFPYVTRADDVLDVSRVRLLALIPGAARSRFCRRITAGALPSKYIGTGLN